MEALALGHKQALQKISLHLLTSLWRLARMLRTSWERLCGWWLHGSRAACQHVDSRKANKLFQTEKREWRLLVQRWRWHQVLGMFSTLRWGKTLASLEEVNRCLPCFIFIEQRIILILISLNGEGQRHRRNVGSHSASKEGWFYQFICRY